MNAQVEDLRNKINQAAAQNTQFTTQKTTILNTITGLETEKAQLLEQLNQINQQVGQKAKELSDQTAVCDQLRNNAQSKAQELADAQN